MIPEHMSLLHKDGFRKLRVRADYEFSQNLIVQPIG